MSDLKVVDAPVEAAPVDLASDLATGYVVGLTKEGQFLFQVLGDAPGLAELMGLCEHAKERIRLIYSTRQVTNDALSVRMIEDLAKIVMDLNAKADFLMKQMGVQVTPDNKL